MRGDLRKVLIIEGHRVQPMRSERITDIARVHRKVFRDDLVRLVRHSHAGRDLLE